MGLLVGLGGSFAQRADRAAKLPAFGLHAQGRVEQLGEVLLASKELLPGLTLETLDRAVLAEQRLERGEQLADLGDEPLGATQVKGLLAPLDPVRHAVIGPQAFALVGLPTSDDRPVGGKPLALGTDRATNPFEACLLLFVNESVLFRIRVSRGGQVVELLAGCRKELLFEELPLATPLGPARFVNRSVFFRKCVSPGGWAGLPGAACRRIPNHHTFPRYPIARGIFGRRTLIHDVQSFHYPILPKAPGWAAHCVLLLL